MKKGITPVLASILIIAMTVASAGVLYTMIQENTERAEENADTSELNLDGDSLRIENCYNEDTYLGNPGKETQIAVRNTLPNNAINASQITPLVKGKIQRNYNVTPEMVSPQSTFTISFDKNFTSEAKVVLTDGSKQIDHYCYGLEN